MSEKLKELISLLYQDRLTQCGKRLLAGNIEKLQKENEVKDKVINEMAEYIASLDIDEDICKNIKCGEEHEEINKCVECVIKFFEKRIK